MSEEIAPAELDFLLRFPVVPHVSSPVDFLSNSSWGGVRSLSSKDEFRYALHSDRLQKLPAGLLMMLESLNDISFSFIVIGIEFKQSSLKLNNCEIQTNYEIPI